MLTRQGKKTFIRNNLRDCAKLLVGMVERMPEDWDGMEMREFIADFFDGERYMGHPYKKREFSKRLRRYRKQRFQVQAGGRCDSAT